jgi:hypothetical protein
MKIEFEKDRIVLSTKDKDKHRLLLQIGGVLDEASELLGIKCDVCASDSDPDVVESIEIPDMEKTLNILLEKLQSSGLIKKSLKIERDKEGLFLKEY